MYGSAFKQAYGWYINKQGFEFGISMFNGLLKNECPSEIQIILNEEPNYTQKEISDLFELNPKEAINLQKKTAQKSRKIWKVIENEIRIKLNVKKIGEKWTNENILYNNLKSIFKNYEIIRHYRPSFLKGLELDFFLPQIDLAIEYQGIQHFKPQEHWGGKKAFNNLIERDQKKKELCSEYGIKIFYFYYYEELSEELILNKLKDFLKNKN